MYWITQRWWLLTEKICNYMFMFNSLCTHKLSILKNTLHSMRKYIKYFFITYSVIQTCSFLIRKVSLFYTFISQFDHWHKQIIFAFKLERIFSSMLVSLKHKPIYFLLKKISIFFTFTLHFDTYKSYKQTFKTMQITGTQ